MQLLRILVFCFFSSILPAYASQEDFDAAIAAKRALWNSTHAHLIWTFNNQTLTEKPINWSSWSLEEYATKLYENTVNPSPWERRWLTFNLFKSHDAGLRPPRLANKENMQVWQDLNLLCGQADKTRYVAQAAFPTLTQAGHVSACITLTQPTIDIAVLQARQTLIRHLVEHPTLYADVQKALTAFAVHEPMLLAFWDFKDHLTNDLQRNVYFRHGSMLEAVNTCEPALQCSVISSIGSRYYQGVLQALACCMLSAYGVTALAQLAIPELNRLGYDQHIGDAGIIFYPFRWLTNPTLRGIVALLAAGFCGHRAIEALQEARGLRVYFQTYRKIIYHTGRALSALDDLISVLAKHHLLMGSDCAALRSAQTDPALRHLFSFSKNPIFQAAEQDGAIFGNTGMFFSFFASFLAQRDKIEACVVALGRLDTLTAGATQLINQPDRWCLPTFLTDYNKPVVAAEEFWHPLIHENAVPNSLMLNEHGARPHVLITGPNAGGKSTTMKALCLSIVLGQTVGIAPAKNLRFTPFKHIKTYLNINDDLGAGNSLFKAEVKRALDLLRTITNAAPGEFGFFIFDEMFSGTTPIEGCASAKTLAEAISRSNKCICLVATHFAPLTELEQTTDAFTNMNVSVVVSPDGSFSYPHKLSRGASHQHIALEILRAEGFSGDFVDRAAQLTRDMAHVEA